MEQAGMQPESILIGGAIAIVASLVAAVVTHWLGAWRDRQRWEHERTTERERWEREENRAALAQRVDAVQERIAACSGLAAGIGALAGLARGHMDHTGLSATVAVLQTVYENLGRLSSADSHRLMPVFRRIEWFAPKESVLSEFGHEAQAILVQCTKELEQAIKERDAVLDNE